MVSHVRRIVTCTASSLERRIIADPKAARCHWVVNASHFGDVDGLQVKYGLPARNRCTRRGGGHGCPSVIRIENCRTKLPITWSYTAGLFHRRRQRVDARVDANKKRLRGERHWPAGRAAGVQSAGVIVNDLRRGQGHLKIHDLGKPWV